MTIQSQTKFNNQDTFEGVLTRLFNQIKRKNCGTTELNAIVTNGLVIAKKADLNYRENGNFDELSQYLLYRIAFQLWSYQHLAIFEGLETDRQQGLEKYTQLVSQHKMVVIELFNALQNLDSDTDMHRRRDNWLRAWQQAVNQISGFFENIKPPLNKHNKRFFLSPFRFSELSPERKYVLLATCIFVLGILLATLLLIRP